MSHPQLGVPRDHAVSFYDGDAELVADVARFVADGLTRGDRVVVVASAAHRVELDEVLGQHGIQPARAQVAGRYLALDAAESLARIVVDGAPDPARFRAAIEPLLDAAAADGCGVRVFGEMVSQLWQSGNVAGAVTLEELWNDVASTRPFSLLCAYPRSALADASLGDAGRVCTAHSELMTPRSYLRLQTACGGAAPTPATSVSDMFVPVRAAVPAARHFVAELLRSWGEDAVLADATLVTSELATNAVEHATSPFRLRCERSEECVRIAVEDVGPSVAQVRTAGPDDFSGRGVAIVAALAQTWGCDVIPDGKRVWADLPRQRG